MGPPELLARIIQDAERSLIDRALAGDQEAGEEVTLRAMGGSFFCQQAILNALGNHKLNGVRTAWEYVLAAEPFSRRAVVTGDPFEVRRLAALLHIKAMELRVQGHHDASLDAHTECAILLTRQTDAGDDEAAALLHSFSGSIEPRALCLASRAIKLTDPIRLPVAAAEARK